MKAASAWRPSKFERTAHGWRAARDPREVLPGSRGTGDLVAAAYVALLERHARGRLLDVGCGKVPLYGVYGPLATEVTCVDWANTTHPSPHLDLETDLNARLPLGDAAYDTILATDVLEHIRRPQDLLHELARLLAPGGKLLLGVPFLYWIHEQPHDYFRYTRFALEDMCGATGLEIEELTPYGGAPEVVLDVLSKHLAAVPGGAACASVGWRVARSRWVQRGAARTRDSFPLGYTVVAAKPVA